jgi:hypothetical protein
MSVERKGERETLERTLQPDAACIPLERLSENPTFSESAHLKSCLRCQTELALWQQITKSEPDPGEGAAVQWVVAELQRRRSSQSRSDNPAPYWAWIRSRGFAVAAACLMLVVAVGYVSWEREPGVRGILDGKATYRTRQMTVLGPVGDVRTPPRELEWVPIAGAAKYEVRLFEVDGNVLWRAVSSTPRVTVPASALYQMAPGKTLMWQVSASDATGARIAESGTQRFRVVLERRPTGG